MAGLLPSPNKLEYKTKTFSDLKESFFDDDDIDYDPHDNKRKLWIKPQKSHINSLKNNKVLFEGFMCKKGKKTKLKKIRYYILTSEFLAYKEKPQSPTIKKLLLLERAKLEFYTRPNLKNNGKASKMGFLFSRNKKGAKVYTRDALVYNEFKEHLSRLCILSSFLDDYSIAKLIGQGSYGKVYLVKRKSDNTLFATKMFQKEVLLSERKGKATLINEIRVLRKLVHPGIMKLYEVHETRISITLIMELLEGGELFERLDTMKFNSEGDFALLLRKIIEPLLFMHENDIMHRDIKPENLIMRSKVNDYDVVVADFGLAQELKKKFIHIRCGTPGYCAPEVLASKAHKPEYDLKCDVFSIGCVFYQIITGNLPFQARNMKEMFSMNKECDISFDDPKIQALSSQARSLLQTMLTKDHNKRPTLAQCLNHDFFFEENKKVNNVVLSFLHPSVNLFARNFQGSKNAVNGKDVSSMPKLDTHGSFTLGKPNMIRGHLETVEEITVLSAAVGIQQMLGLPRSTSQKAIQEKLSLKFINDSKTKFFSDQNMKSFANIDQEREEDEVLNTSLDEPDVDIPLQDQKQENKHIEVDVFSPRRKEKVDAKMQNLTSRGKIQNPFQKNLQSVNMG